MKKTKLLILAIVAFASNLAAQDDVSSAHWQSKSITIDGINKEWVKPLRFHDDESGLMFSISNDSTNLYLCFSNIDDKKSIKMMRAGWKIEFLSKEKKKKFDASITFPAVAMAMGTPVKSIGTGDGNDDNRKNSFNKRSSADLSDLINTYKLHLVSVTVAGMKTKNGELPLINNNGLQIGVGKDTIQYIVYEFAIPLKELYADNTSNLNEKIKMNVTVNAMERPVRSGGGEGGRGGRSGGGMGGGMGGGRGGRGSYGGGGGNRGGNSSDRSAMYEKNNFNQEFKLTNK